MFRYLLIVAIAIVSVGCSLKRPVVSVVGSLAWEGQSVLEEESDVELARKTTPSLIIALDVLRQSYPADRRYAALVAKAYGQYAYGFYEERLLRQEGNDDRARLRADRFYQKGKEAGLVALKKNRSFRKGLQAPQVEFERALQRFSKRDIPLLFWTAFCWGGSLNLHRDDPLALVELPRVTAMLHRVIELESSYEHGAALAFRGVLESVRPPMLGGRPQEAKASFEAAIAVEPRYLMTKVLYAQYYAVQMQDRELFEELLSEVVETDATAFPEQRLANELAKRRGEILLAQEGKWF